MKVYSRSRRNVTLLKNYFKTRYGISPREVSRNESVYIETDCNSWRISDHTNVFNTKGSVEIICTMNGGFIVCYQGKCMGYSTMKEIKSAIDGIIATEGLFALTSTYKAQITSLLAKMEKDKLKSIERISTMKKDHAAVRKERNTKITRLNSQIIALKKDCAAITNQKDREINELKRQLQELTVNNN